MNFIVGFFLSFILTSMLVSNMYSDKIKLSKLIEIDNKIYKCTKIME